MTFLFCFAFFLRILKVPYTSLEELIKSNTQLTTTVWVQGWPQLHRWALNSQWMTSPSISPDSGSLLFISGETYAFCHDLYGIQHVLYFCSSKLCSLGGCALSKDILHPNAQSEQLFGLHSLVLDIIPINTLFSLKQLSSFVFPSVFCVLTK
jgi:hypothetical protein